MPCHRSGAEQGCQKSDKGFQQLLTGIGRMFCNSNILQKSVESMQKFTEPIGIGEVAERERSGHIKTTEDIPVMR